MMKLGTQTGSLVNHLHSRATIGQPEPKVGMGVTMLCWTDRHPGTIFRVFTLGKKNPATCVEVRSDKYQRTDANGMSESQDYTYTTTPSGAKSFYRQEADGSWQEVRENESKRWVKAGGKGLVIGKREKYHDFSF